MMTPPPGEPFWIEHKSPDGKAYYSNPITQETTWQRPANVLVRPGPPFATPTSQPSSPTPPQLPFPQASGGALLIPTKVWSEHKNSEGKVYYYNKITLQSVWEKPKDFDLILPMPVAMASSGPANDASTPGTAAAGATPSGSSDGDTQKEGSGQLQENGDTTQQSNSLTADQPPDAANTPADPQMDEATPGEARVESMEAESSAPTTVVTTALTVSVYTLFIIMHHKLVAYMLCNT